MPAQRDIHIFGDVVSRPRKPWTATVQSFLKHLHNCGLPVPEPLGYDEHTEYVRLVKGDAGEDAWPHQLELSGLRSAGLLLRQLHEASQKWQPPAHAEWSVPPSAGGVVCHGDPQPSNFAWRDGRVVGLFDFDAARPAAPLSDVAYALLWFTPVNAHESELRRRGFIAAPDREARAEALLEGYGWNQPIDLLEVCLDRHRQAIDEVVLLGNRGHEPHASWVTQRWPDRWRADLADLRRIALNPSRPRPPLLPPPNDLPHTEIGRGSVSDR